MGAFLAGFVMGVLALVVFVIYQATRPERLGPLLLQAFQAMRLHLGRNAAVSGVTGPRGWALGALCLACREWTPIKPDVPATFICQRCNKPLKQSSNDAGGTGENHLEVQTVNE